MLLQCEGLTGRGSVCVLVDHPSHLVFTQTHPFFSIFDHIGPHRQSLNLLAWAAKVFWLSVPHPFCSWWICIILPFALLMMQRLNEAILSLPPQLPQRTFLLNSTVGMSLDSQLLWATWLRKSSISMGVSLSWRHPLWTWYRSKTQSDADDWNWTGNCRVFLGADDPQCPLPVVCKKL